MPSSKLSGERPLPGDRWAISMDTGGVLRARMITPEWGGGGWPVMLVSEHETAIKQGMQTTFQTAYELDRLREAAQAMVDWHDKGDGRHAGSIVETLRTALAPATPTKESDDD